LFQARTETQENGTTAMIAHATCDELEAETGRPRAMVADGLKRLQRTGLVTPQGSA
jgi:DNA-binding transcriptional regulator GbsR (MarR family)